jgi:Flagellar assembly protein FliH.
MNNLSAKARHMTDTPLKKFMFDNEFGSTETVDDVQSITPKQMATAIDAAKTSAFAEGYQKGVQETNADIARIAGDQLFIITHKLEELIQTEAQILSTFHQEVSQLADLITRTVLPVLSERGAREEVQKILADTLTNVPKANAVEVTVHPSLVDEIQRHLDTLREDQKIEVHIKVVSNETFQLTDCRMTWAGTGIERYLATCMQEIHGALMRLGKTPYDLTTPENPEIQETPAKGSEEIEKV